MTRSVSNAHAPNVFPAPHRLRCVYYIITRLFQKSGFAATLWEERLRPGHFDIALLFLEHMEAFTQSGIAGGVVQ